MFLRLFFFLVRMFPPADGLARFAAMAKSKPTARKSTGGKAPRRPLGQFEPVMKAARTCGLDPWPTLIANFPGVGSMRGEVDELSADGKVDGKVIVDWKSGAARDGKVSPTDAPIGEKFRLRHTVESVEELERCFQPPPAGEYSRLSEPPPGCRWLSTSAVCLDDLGPEWCDPVIDEKRWDATLYRLRDPPMVGHYEPHLPSYPEALMQLGSIEMYGGGGTSREYVSCKAYAYNDEWLRKGSGKTGEMRALEFATGEVRKRHALWAKAKSGSMESVAALWKDAFDALWGLLLMLSNHSDGSYSPPSWPMLESPARLEKMCANVALVAEQILCHPSAAYDWGDASAPPRCDGGIALFELVRQAESSFDGACCEVDSWEETKATAAWAKVKALTAAILEKGKDANGKTHTAIACAPSLNAMLAAREKRLAAARQGAAKRKR